MVIRYFSLIALLGCADPPDTAPATAPKVSPAASKSNAEASSSANVPAHSIEPERLKSREEKFGAPVMGNKSTHRSIEPDPDQSRSKEPDISRARELVEASQVEEAAAILELAVQARPQDSDAHYWLGRTHELQGAHDLAVQAMMRATEIDPEFASAWWGVGFNYTFQRRCADALPAQSRYIELRPDDAGGYYNRAGCRWYTQDREGSLEDGGKACEMGHQMACQHVEKQLKRMQMLEAFEAQRAADQEEEAP